jgi:hypothetical protein
VAEEMRVMQAAMERMQVAYLEKERRQTDITQDQALLLEQAQREDDQQHEPTSLAGRVKQTRQRTLTKKPSQFPPFYTGPRRTQCSCHRRPWPIRSWKTSSTGSAHRCTASCCDE